MTQESNPPVLSPQVSPYGAPVPASAPSITHDQHSAHEPMDIIAKQLKRIFSEYGDGPHFDNLERLLVHEAFAHVRANQVHSAALLGISRNVMRTLLKRHGLLETNHGAIAENAEVL